jgi:hypothetical protein
MSERRGMEAEDWLSAGFNVVIGLFLGLAVNGLLELIVDGFWLFALIVAVLGAGAAWVLLAFEGVMDRLFERIFPSGIRPSQSPRPERRKPIARLMSMPAGILLGVILAQMGLTQAILGMM